MSKQLVTTAKALGGNMLAPTTTHAIRIEIKSASSDRLYVVALSNATGEWQCSCPGWCMKKPGKPRGCKHLKAMQPALEAAAAPAALKAAK